MNILILSLGGGGGNILRSMKALFRRDLAAIQQTDPSYAEQLRRSVVTRFLDTNEFSTSDVAPEERVIIGAATTRGVGSRHDPEVARRALDESKGEIVTETQNGWQLWDGRIVARGAGKPSPDNLFHLCERSDRTIICFYAPPGGS